jgi:hypothetical protein
VAGKLGFFSKSISFRKQKTDQKRNKRFRPYYIPKKNFGCIACSAGQVPSQDKVAISKYTIKSTVFQKPTKDCFVKIYQ